MVIVKLPATIEAANRMEFGSNGGSRDMSSWCLSCFSGYRCHVRPRREPSGGPMAALIGPDAILAVMATCIVSLVFLLKYAATLAHYDETYGSLGAPSASSFWIWASTSAQIAGAELNAHLEKPIENQAKALPIQRAVRGLNEA
jgi:hypothetical protein